MVIYLENLAFSYADFCSSVQFWFLCHQFLYSEYLEGKNTDLTARLRFRIWRGSGHQRVAESYLRRFALDCALCKLIAATCVLHPAYNFNDGFNPTVCPTSCPEAIKQMVTPIVICWLTCSEIWEVHASIYACRTCLAEDKCKIPRKVYMCSQHYTVFSYSNIAMISVLVTLRSTVPVMHVWQVCTSHI